MGKNGDRKKRKRPAVTESLNVKQTHDKKERKKKAKKEKKINKQKGDKGDGVGIGNDDNRKVSKEESYLPLMSSIFGGDNSTGNGSTSLMDSIFDNKKRVANGKSSSSTASLFDNPTTKTVASTKHQWMFAKSSTKGATVDTSATREKSNPDDVESIRKILKVRKNRSERRPLLRKALDFPGVFSNEEVDEENGFFLLDDENERAKETADAVRDHGLCVIRNVIDTGNDSKGDAEDDTDNSDGDGGDGDGNNNPLRDIVLPAAKALQRKLNNALKVRNIHHSRETFRFREAASRCKGRTDVVFDALEKDKSIAEIGRKILYNPKVYPVIRNLLGAGDSDSDTNEGVKLVYAGLIFSYPGSCDQPWHQDGTPLFPELPREQSAMLQASLPPYALNVFLPLEDEDGSVEKGPTEFIPNSHKWESPDEKLHLVNETSDEIGDEDEIISDSDDSDGSDDDMDDNKDEAIIAPVLKCGDALIYDYRVCHRGTANVFGKLEGIDDPSGDEENSDSSVTMKTKKNEDDVSGTRRILYLMYSRPWFTDHVNFDYKKSAESLFD